MSTNEKNPTNFSRGSVNNAYSLIFGSLGLLGLFNGLQMLLRELQPQLNMTYYPLELNSTAIKAAFFLLFGIISIVIVLNHEIQERETSQV